MCHDVAVAHDERAYGGHFIASSLSISGCLSGSDNVHSSNLKKYQHCPASHRPGRPDRLSGKLSNLPVDGSVLELLE